MFVHERHEKDEKGGVAKSVRAEVWVGGRVAGRDETLSLALGVSALKFGVCELIR
jgi:hypothetical protein